jgi:hypothetical protein
MASQSILPDRDKRYSNSEHLLKKNIFNEHLICPEIISFSHWGLAV